MTSHLEEKLQQDIGRIRDKVREMADLALRGLEDSVKALTTGDTKLAYAAILRDARIDDLESMVDGLCVEFIVRHIPVAAHLRFVHSVAKIISELERVGDYAESINRQAILLSRDEKPRDFGKFAQLASVSVEMVRQAVRSFLDEDLELADRTIALDAKTNRIHQEIYEDLERELPVDSEELSRLFSLLSVANRYERVADQACNICEEVYYLVTGEVAKHKLTTDVEILFVSTARSCRALMAEGIADRIAGDNFDFFACEVDRAQPDLKAVEFLARKAIDVSDHQPRVLGEIADIDRFRAIVAIGKEAAEALPTTGYHTLALEWEVADPAAARGGEEAVADAYTACFDDLLDRISELIKSMHGTVSGLESHK